MSHRLRSGLIVVLVAACSTAQAQSITVHVYRRSARNGEASPAAGVNVLATPALNLGTRSQQFWRLAPNGAGGNQYSTAINQYPQSVDLVLLQAGSHPLAVRDLSLAPGRDHLLHLVLLDTRFSINAPECLALKTEYEYLFRREEQAVPGRSEEEIEHAARLKYADGILALPNPDRYDVQSPENRAMLDAMDGDDRGELNGMMEGLFDLYGMDNGFDRYVPSLWASSYPVGNRTVHAEVELMGTHGEYRITNPQGQVQTNLLEEIDIAYNEQEDRYLITGRFRYAPGTNNEQTGRVRWVINDEGSSFSGSSNWTGDLIRDADNWGEQPPPPP